MRVVDVVVGEAWGPEDEMQDELLVIQRDLGQYCLAVFDGHGPRGAVIAAEAARTVESAVNRSKDLEAATSYTLIAYAGLHTRLRRLPEQPGFKYSGTTATTLLTDQARAHSVWIGDCAAKYFADDDEVIPLTTSHDTFNEDELQRISELSAEAPNNTQPIDMDMPEYTRALGSHGIPWLSSQPELRRHTIERPGQLVIGTPGVWGTTHTTHALVEALIRGSTPPDRIAFFCSEINERNASIIVARFE